MVRILGCKAEEETGVWRKPGNEEGNQFKEDDMGVACGACGSDYKFTQNLSQKTWRQETP